MAGVRGVGGVPEPAPDRASELHGRKREDIAEVAAKDGVQISASAQKAAEVARLKEASQDEPAIRADRVAAAKERLARGDYKREDVVAKVAKRLLQQIPE